MYFNSLLIISQICGQFLLKSRGHLSLRPTITIQGRDRHWLGKVFTSSSPSPKALPRLFLYIFFFNSPSDHRKKEFSFLIFQRRLSFQSPELKTRPRETHTSWNSRDLILSEVMAFAEGAPRRAPMSCGGPSPVGSGGFLSLC